MNHFHHKKAFRWFLVLYTAVLLFHIVEVPWRSGLVITFVLGFAFATIAHFRSGMLTIALLLAHMGLEWTGYATHGIHYETAELVFLLIHGALDIVFLWQELSAHLMRYRIAIMGVAGAGIAIALVVAHVLPHADTIVMASDAHEHTSLLEPLILGGILGCTLWHIGIWKKREQ
jgi:hypothetical protein